MHGSFFNGKLAVVTGASDGIGKAISLALANEGAQVIALARSKEKLDALCEKFPDRITGMSVDLGRAEDASRAFEEINRKNERIDILVNNVGAGTFKPIDRQSEGEIEVAVNLPFRVAVQACHAFAPRMIEQRSGSIVSLTSPAGFVPFPYMAPYVAARHAMVGLAHSLHEELKASNVQSLLFCPAEVNTGYFKANDANIDWYPKVSELFRTLEPEEVASAILRSIEKGERQRIYPFSLALFVRLYQLMPRTSIAVLSLLKMWQPKAKVHEQP